MRSHEPERTAALEALARFRGHRAEKARGYALLDVFTDVPLQGNQLAVFTDGRGLPAETMQRLAREMGYSETVFLLAPEHEGDVRLRIFTPSSELPFAGHPVLGTAVLTGCALQRSEVTLETGLGAIEVRLEQRATNLAFARMRQRVPPWRAYESAPDLLLALGVKRSGLPVEIYENGPRHVYVELECEADVAALRPDMRALGDLGALCANCFAVSGRRVRTRMFAPALGVDEDAATGSAAGPLAVHLARHGRIAFGEELEIAQGEEIGRPSLLYASAGGSEAAIASVEVGGAAVIVAHGEFLIE